MSLTLFLVAAGGVHVAFLSIKKTICGRGSAGKEQVRRALAMTVPGLARFDLSRVGLDATDALAVAVCHQVQAGFAARIGKGEG